MKDEKVYGYLGRRRNIKRRINMRRETQGELGREEGILKENEVR